MEIKEMNMAEIEERTAVLKETMNDENADLDAIEKEVTELETRKAEIMQEVEQRKAQLAEVEKSAVIETIEKEEIRHTMDIKELRNSQEYINAYAEGLKTGDFRECRELLKTENAGGTIAVPDFVDEIIHTAWNNDQILGLVRKLYNVKGNFKANYEISGTDAIVHTEGGEAITPEDLALGLKTIVQHNVKKVLPITDEAYELRGEAFIRYVYDELAYRIVKTAVGELLDEIQNAPATSSATQPGVPAITANTISVGTVAEALGNLSERAENPVIVMNRLSWAAFKAAQYAGQFNVDPFEGLRVVYSDKLPAFSAAATGKTYAIVGDFGAGALATFPGESEEVQYKFDDLTRKNEDVIEVFGRLMVGLGVVAPNAFVKIVK